MWLSSSILVLGMTWSDGGQIRNQDRMTDEDQPLHWFVWENSIARLSSLMKELEFSLEVTVAIWPCLRDFRRVDGS